jgi:hypothetical protein
MSTGYASTRYVLADLAVPYAEFAPHASASALGYCVPAGRGVYHHRR